jgi:hypothetical protein
MPKQCPKCEQEKPDDAFYESSAKCKSCTCAAVKANRAAKADYYKAYDRVRYAEHGYRGEASKEAQARAVRAWIKRNRAKRRAHSQVARARRTLHIEPPAACERCGTVCAVQAHHHDYAKPLDVEWLCSACHGAEHRRYDWDEDRRRIQRGP